MNGLIPHYYKGEMQGKVFVSGKDISKLSLHEIGHIVGTVFQDPRSQFFTTTTDEEIAFGLQTICKSRDEIKQRVVLIEHRLYYVKSLFDRFLLMRDGKIETVLDMSESNKFLILDKMGGGRELVR